MCWSVSCRVILKLWHSVQWSDWLDNLINAVPFASSMPEVVSISKYWKDCIFKSKPTSQFADDFSYLSSSHLQNPVLNVFPMYFCCQSEGRLYWPQVCRISFATRSVPKWKWRLTSQQESSKKVHLSGRKTSKGFYRKTYDYIKAYSPAYDLIREQ